MSCCQLLVADVMPTFALLQMSCFQLLIVDVMLSSVSGRCHADNCWLQMLHCPADVMLLITGYRCHDPNCWLLSYCSLLVVYCWLLQMLCCM